jgi:hypothetical protein
MRSIFDGQPPIHRQFLCRIKATNHGHSHFSLLSPSPLSSEVEGGRRQTRFPSNQLTASRSFASERIAGLPMMQGPTVGIRESSGSRLVFFFLKICGVRASSRAWFWLSSCMKWTPRGNHIACLPMQRMRDDISSG